MVRRSTPRLRTHETTLECGLVVLLFLVLVAACTGSGSEPRDQRAANLSRTAQALGAFDANGATGEKMAAAVADLIAQDATRGYGDMRLMVWIDDEVALTHQAGSTIDDSENVASVTKSVVGLLVGIALDRGDLPGLDTTVAELLPVQRNQMAAGVGEVTLEQLLTHTGGLRGDEGPTNFFDGTENWVRVILSEPLRTPPGETFAYSSAGSHLLAAILAEQTAQPVLNYAQRHLFGPLGLDTTPATEVLTESTPGNVRRYELADFAWPHDHQGYHAGYAWLKLNLADMATVGRMMLADGLWKGRQVVPERWVRQSTAEHASDGDLGYGYHWWVTTADGHPAFLAGGYGGQLIEVVPDLNLVVAVLTPIPPDTPPRSSWEAMESMVDFVIAPHVS
jgi:CubicO group peptidase (beta-lactamase class C family)